MRQLTKKERELTEKGLKMRENILSGLNEQLKLNKLKTDFIKTQRKYQDQVAELENKQEDKMFNQVISTTKSLIEKEKDREKLKDLNNELSFNEANYEKILRDREFKNRWGPYTRGRTDKQNKQKEKELNDEINLNKNIINELKSQLVNGVERRSE